MEDSVKKIPYQISLNGVCECVRYLYKIEYCPNENGREIKLKYGRKKFNRRTLRLYLDNIVMPMYEKGKRNSYSEYDGDFLWEHLFLADEELSDRIRYKGFTSLNQLHYHARIAAERDKGRRIWY